ncbi:TOPRIM nucleotidyl transferase/hydrolase domain-containing protein [Streptacidiphilus fuscans]|uniref:TOPRIM nucleotidyl transferase/hydrolase domain-containing protein n=1 Tax=Streptacidiphilus fuscans TaxID=2789292 RepID=UPI001C074AAE|nr:TOPRIM nucleotidyl transferase/hydrolase domain-containing protein [Streptacidiphilus fuscans]
MLVEGVSDRVALEVVARRRGIDLAGGGVSVVAMQGINNVGRFLAYYGATAPGVRVAGLYDAAEERFVRRGLDLEPSAASQSGSDLEARGFYCCSADLEDELIRALGPEAVVDLVAAEGELRSFRTLQKQPALRARSLHDQLRRMMSGRSGGKKRYAALMAEAVAPEQVPRPLAQVLACALGDHHG